MPLCSFEEGVGGLEWALQCVGREGNPDGPMRVPIITGLEWFRYMHANIDSRRL